MMINMSDKSEQCQYEHSIFSCKKIFTRIGMPEILENLF